MVTCPVDTFYLSSLVLILISLKQDVKEKGEKKKKKKLMSFTYKLPRMNDNLLPLQIRIPSYHKGV